MSQIKKFEDLNCWREARVLVKSVYKLTQNRGFKNDYGLCNQIQRASVSAMTNIAEGFARYSSKEVIRFLDFTQSSCEEVKSLLYVAFDLDYISKSELKAAYTKACDVKHLTLGLIRYLRTQDTKRPT